MYVQKLQLSYLMSHVMSSEERSLSHLFLNFDFILIEDLRFKKKLLCKG